MNRILLAFMLALSSVASAQVQYPYNPDAEPDGFIGVGDVLEILPQFGSAFTPQEITVNGEGLSTVLEEMQTALDSLSIITDGTTAFGEKVFMDFDSMKWTMDAWESAVFNPITDGILEIVPEVGEIETLHVLVIPEELDPCAGNYDDCNFPPWTFWYADDLSNYQYGTDYPHTIPVSQSELVFVGSGYGDIGGENVKFIWTPFVSVQSENASSSGCADIDEDGICDFADACIVDVCGVCGGDGICCGNGIVEGDEECDDGNSDPSDGCDGCQIVWVCGDPVDYWGYSYETVLIGEQCWFSENLRSENYATGEAILQGVSGAEWFDLSIGACITHPDDVGLYGHLYNWFATQDERGLCPTGWSVPSDQDFIDLYGNYESVALAAGALKSTGTVEGGDGLWYAPNIGATNASGFSALPSGQYRCGGQSSGGCSSYYSDLGYFNYMWTRTEASPSLAFHTNLYSYVEASSVVLNNDKNDGKSIRCIKDQ